MTEINEINIKFIANEDQAYPTIGNYWIEGDTLQIRVSKMPHTVNNCLVALHELAEWITTDFYKIKEQDIMDFDLAYEKEREEWLHSDIDEPGFDPRCPYMNMHALATSIEMMLCGFMGISWNGHNETVMTL